jgi:dihydroxyacetone kinase-like predicted kinase
MGMDRVVGEKFLILREVIKEVKQMKLVYNVEMSNIKEVVINRKVFYNRNDENIYERDDKRTKPSIIEKNIMPEVMGANEMAKYVRDYIGIKRWKIVLSSGTINIFNKKTLEKMRKEKSKILKVKKSKR